MGQAYEDFRWDSNDFGVNTRKLLDLQVKIRNDIRRKSKGDLLAHLCDVLAWGGVLTTAVTRPLLEKYKKNELLNYFGWIYEQGPFDASSEDLSELKNIPLDAGVLLSNSGLTKICVIYSRCVIYDNRVAAAVGKIIVDYLAEKPLVAELSLVMGLKPGIRPLPAQISKEKGGYSYPCSAKSNVVVNWLISTVVDQLLTGSSGFKDEVKQLSNCSDGLGVEQDEKWMAMRIYESGLFGRTFCLSN